MSVLKVETLTREAFAPFGAVIDTDGVTPQAINGGDALRFHALAEIDVADAPPVISVFVANKPATEPAGIALLERHPHGSQAFVPLSPGAWIVVVATAPEPGAMRAFAVAPGQGVQIGRGVWHAPLVAFSADSRFLVVDRDRPKDNVEVRRFDEPVRLAPLPRA